MKNSFGNQITVTLFGESHGECIGAVVDGLAPGLRVSDESIRRELTRRRPAGGISTGRVEDDAYSIVSGCRNGYTTGTPLCILIPNTQKKSEDYNTLANTPRPSHADFAARMKYHGFEDTRGGGHFSGRVTAALVAVGAILRDALSDAFGIEFGTHIRSVGDVPDLPFTGKREELLSVRGLSFPVLDPEAGEKMREIIESAHSARDSVGGVLECQILGMPSGVGEPWFDSVESVLSHLLFSIGGVKGVEFGDGFGITRLYGSEANDPFFYDGKCVKTATNHSGGINGGITNGMPVIFRAAIKPTPSIYKEQKTVNLATGENTSLTLSGRHDPAIVHRAAAVVDAVVAIGIADLLVTRYGTDALKNGNH